MLLYVEYVFPKKTSYDMSCVCVGVCVCVCVCVWGGGGGGGGVLHLFHVTNANYKPCDGMAYLPCECPYAHLHGCIGGGIFHIHIFYGSYM